MTFNPDVSAGHSIPATGDVVRAATRDCFKVTINPAIGVAIVDVVATHPDVPFALGGNDLNAIGGRGISDNDAFAGDYRFAGHHLFAGHHRIRRLDVMFLDIHRTIVVGTPHGGQSE